MEITKEWLESKNACSPSLNYVCENGYIGLYIKSFINKLIKDERLSDANWLITKYMNKINNVKYAIFAAEQVIDIFEKKYPEDKRPRKAIEAAKTYINNPCYETKAYAADAADDAYAAYTAAAYAAYAYAAADAAAAAAYAAYAADDAAAAYAADAYAAYTADAAAAAAAAYAADAYAAYAADDAAADARKDMRIKILNYGLELINDNKA